MKCIMFLILVTAYKIMKNNKSKNHRIFKRPLNIDEKEVISIHMYALIKIIEYFRLSKLLSTSGFVKRC